MKTTLLTLILTLSGGLATPVGAGVLAGPITNAANGHLYYLLTQSTWTAAEAEAVSLGGHLVTINDAAENAWVLSTFSGEGATLRSLWIGLSDHQQEGTFVWASGESSAFSAWEEGQPDDGGGAGLGDDFVHIWPLGGFRSPGLWNDFEENHDSVLGYPLHGVVEFGSTPSTPTLTIRPAIEICWQSLQAVRYQLQRAASPDSAHWVDIGAPVTGTGGQLCVTDASRGFTQRIYRLLVVP